MYTIPADGVVDFFLTDDDELLPPLVVLLLETLVDAWVFCFLDGTDLDVDDSASDSGRGILVGSTGGDEDEDLLRLRIGSEIEGVEEDIVAVAGGGRWSMKLLLLAEIDVLIQSCHCQVT